MLKTAKILIWVSKLQKAHRHHCASHSQERVTLKNEVSPQEKWNVSKYRRERKWQKSLFSASPALTISIPHHTYFCRDPSEIRLLPMCCLSSSLLKSTSITALFSFVSEHACKDFTCKLREFCISPDLLCDDVNHCGDGSDEATSTTCTREHTSKETFIYQRKWWPPMNVKINAQFD